MRWEHYHAYDQYYDFERVLYTMPDKQDTDVVMVLTFNAETRTAYYVLKLTKKDGNTVDWEHDHKLTWEEALKVVLSEGVPAFFPEELLTIGEMK